MVQLLLDTVRRRIAPPRFVLFCVLFAGGLALFPPTFGRTHGIMAAFDSAAAAFLLAIAPLLRGGAGTMRWSARNNDANRALLLVLVGVVMLVILIAVASEMRGKSSTTTIVLIIGTLALAWLFSNSIYALHYAHLYYGMRDGGGDAGGLAFPETSEPNYWDFAYFSFTLGMTFQTSDVSVTSTPMRQTVIGQSLAAFVFNIGVLAFSINVLGSG